MQLAVRKRSAALFNGLGLAALIAILALVALVTKPPPPPNVAEFAPQAVEQITDSPANQSSRFGSGASEGTSGAGDLSLDSTSRTLEVARARRCIGNPPRQTEDPHSPPCVNNWEGDNGGATAMGVTRDEIRVIIPITGSHREPPSIEETAALFVAHFNSRYEFYGRKITPIIRSLPVQDGTPERQLAVAQGVAKDSPFAATQFRRGAESFYEELARNKVIAFWAGEDVGANLAMFASSDYRTLAPYLWGTYPAHDEIQEAVAGFACESLSGRDARHGGPEYIGTKRHFGAFLESRNRRVPDVKPLRSGLARCGEALEVVEFRSDQDDPGKGELRTALVKMKEAGATTVTCICYSLEISQFAEPVGYRPEWIVNGLASQDFQTNTEAYGQQDRRFGITPRTKIVPLEQEPWFWAVAENRGGYHPPSNGGINLRQIYRSLLVLASGVQGAGPNLTPRTFENALHRMKFPNPNAGTAPYWQQSIGFESGDYTWVEDYAVHWFDRNATAYDGVSGSPGSFCYVDRGARFKPGTFPADADAKLFDRTQPCR